MNAVVIGGGLAGCEAAYQLLKRGVAVTMLEMKRIKKSPAHTLDTLCELVCSNSLKSDSADTSSGLLKAEMRLLDSLVIKCADSSKIPAGNALAVDRIKFSQAVEAELKKFPQFRLVSEVANNVETGVVTVVATGPLTDDALVPALEKIFGKGLYFFDAVAPIVTRESIDFSHAFCAGRYGKGGDDYVNCPMDKETYEQFWQQLVAAETVEVKDFENEVFEACMPIEVMAKRGINTALFGPLKPVGLTDPATGKRPYAVLQLRSENADGTLLNLVGFQTHLKFGEQKRVFSMIPALKNAEFVRYGVMHRNTYFDSPKYLGADFALKGNPELFFAGQMTGVEGYVESAASGLVAGINAAKRLQGQPPVVFPAETIIGALSNHVANSCGKFVPMNGNFGILSPFGEKIKDKNERNKRYSQRSLEAIAKIKNLL